VGVQVKLRNPLRTRAIPERFWGGDSLRRGAISSVYGPLPLPILICSVCRIRDFIVTMHQGTSREDDKHASYASRDTSASESSRTPAAEKQLSDPFVSRPSATSPVTAGLGSVKEAHSPLVVPAVDLSRAKVSLGSPVEGTFLQVVEDESRRQAESTTARKPKRPSDVDTSGTAGTGRP